MKALQTLYIVVWLYAMYYICYMLYKTLGEDAVPIFISFGFLFILKWVIGYIRLKE